MEIIFAVIHEKGWGQEGQLRSCCSNSGMTELVISRATKGAHPRDISRASAVGLLILDIRNEGGEESRRTSIVCIFGEEIC